MSKIETDLWLTLCATIARYAMFTPGDTVVVGVSGGPDSTALLHALVSLRAEWQLSLIAAHLNHGFRGSEADQDAEYVRRFCADLDVPCRIEFVDVPALQKRLHRSAQQAARAVRHAFLRQVAQETTNSETTRIALGHTRNDRVETLLLNLVRGTGLEGLRGFPPMDPPLVRPLYDVTRAQVTDYCARHGLQPRQDSSNADTHYLRNRIRHELLPALRAHYNPNVEAALLRLADIAGEEEAWRAAETAPMLAQIATFTAETSVELPLDGFNALPLAIRRRVLRQAIAHARGHLQDVRFEAISALIDAAESGRRCLLELPASEQGTVQMECDGSRIRIREKLLQAQPISWQAAVNTPGRTRVPQAGVTVLIWFCASDTIMEIAATLDREIQAAQRVEGESVLRGQFLVFARQQVTLPLSVRSWRHGDRMRPRGLDGSKKLQDLFTDAKIPASDRARVPVLVEAEETDKLKKIGERGRTGRILAVGDLRVDETTLTAVRLPVEPTNLMQKLRELNRPEERDSNPAPIQELLAVLLLYE